MSSEDGCPLCGKPVLGRTALLGHLEFAHEVDDPASFLEEVLRPDAPARRGLPVGALARRSLPVLVALALAGAAFVGYQQLVVGSGADTAGAQATDPEATTTTRPEAAAPTTLAPPTSTAVPTTTTSPSTTTSTTTTTTTTTTTMTTTTAPARSDLEFRKPFLVDASHDACRVVDGQAVHTISFTFSGSRNITFDGVLHPDRTGDGRHTTTHAVPVGTTAYLDHVVVLDPDGEAHDVEVSPPVYLGAC